MMLPNSIHMLRALQALFAVIVLGLDASGMRQKRVEPRAG